MADNYAIKGAMKGLMAGLRGVVEGKLAVKQAQTAKARQEAEINLDNKRFNIEQAKAFFEEIRARAKEDREGQYFKKQQEDDTRVKKLQSDYGTAYTKMNDIIKKLAAETDENARMALQGELTVAENDVSKIAGELKYTQPKFAPLPDKTPSEVWESQKKFIAEREQAGDITADEAKTMRSLAAKQLLQQPVTETEDPVQSYMKRSRAIKTLVDSNEITPEVAAQMLKATQNELFPPVKSDTLSSSEVLADELDAIAKLKEERGVSDEEIERLTLAKINEFAGTPKKTGQTLQEKIAEVNAVIDSSPHIKDKDEAKKKALESIVDIDEEDTTVDVTAQSALDKYTGEDQRSNLEALTGLSNAIKVDNVRNHFILSADRYMKQTSFSEMNEEDKELTAKLFVQATMANIQGGDIVKRHLRVYELLRVHLPEIMKEIEALKAEGVDLGKFTAAAEATGNFFGNTANEKVARLNTRIKDIVASFVALRSGAQVTEQERTMYTNIFSQIGRGYELNKAAISGLMDNVLVELNSTYTNLMGDEWGEYATNVIFYPGEIKEPLKWKAPADREPGDPGGPEEITEEDADDFFKEYNKEKVEDNE